MREDRHLSALFSALAHLSRFEIRAQSERDSALIRDQMGLKGRAKSMKKQVLTPRLSNLVGADTD